MKGQTIEGKITCFSYFFSKMLFNWVKCTISFLFVLKKFKDEFEDRRVNNFIQLPLKEPRLWTTVGASVNIFKQTSCYKALTFFSSTYLVTLEFAQCIFIEYFVGNDGFEVNMSRNRFVIWCIKSRLSLQHSLLSWIFTPSNFIKYVWYGL